ncbi:RYamide receptor-like [Watersipora subatra]|uniref:RYamide receptor-like n=1 Tax=Watersipora subatra TaxID=2589382 RepID=UPI00355BB44D
MAGVFFTALSVGIGEERPFPSHLFFMLQTLLGRSLAWLDVSGQPVKMSFAGVGKNVEHMAGFHIDTKVADARLSRPSSSTLGVTFNIFTILAISFGKKTGKKVKVQLINLAVADCLMAVFVVPGYTYVDELFLSTTLQSEIEQLVNQELVEHFHYEFEPPFCSGIDLSSYYYLKLLIRFIVPVSVILISYTAIFLKLWLRRQSRFVQNTSTDQHKASQKVLIMLAVDSLLTLITWLPFNILLVFDSTPLLDKNPSNFYITEVTLYMLMGTNAFSTPVVYLIFNKNFRHSFFPRKLLTDLVLSWRSIPKSSLKLDVKLETPNSLLKWKNTPSRETIFCRTLLCSYLEL